LCLTALANVLLIALLVMLFRLGGTLETEFARAMLTLMPDPPAPPLRWEYTVESPRDSHLVQSIDLLGEQGWELVTARRATSEDGDKPRYEMIFKRLIGDAQRQTAIAEGRGANLSQQATDVEQWAREYRQLLTTAGWSNEEADDIVLASRTDLSETDKRQRKLDKLLNAHEADRKEREAEAQKERDQEDRQKREAAKAEKQRQEAQKNRPEELKAEAVKTLERLQQEIEGHAKELGKLPDQETIDRLAFTGAMRDPWSLALKVQIVDAETGKYIITSAGPDLTYGAADDLRLECEMGK
jgi:hypothetical protein